VNPFCVYLSLFKLHVIKTVITKELEFLKTKFVETFLTNCLSSSKTCVYHHSIRPNLSENFEKFWYTIQPPYCVFNLVFTYPLSKLSLMSWFIFLYV